MHKKIAKQVAKCYGCSLYILEKLFFRKNNKWEQDKLKKKNKIFLLNLNLGLMIKGYT